MASSASAEVATTWGVKQLIVLLRDLGCHGTRYVRYGRGWYAYPVRTVRGALGARRPAPPVGAHLLNAGGRYARPVRTQRRPRGVRVSSGQRKLGGGTRQCTRRAV